jgi:hypothetical protein
MRILLGRLKELVEGKAPPDELEYRINRVIERAITCGKWDGALQIISLVARWGVVTLPPMFRTLVGGKIGGIVRQPSARYFDFMPGKADQYGDTIQIFRDAGDYFATLYPLPLGGRGYTSPPTAAITGDGTGASVNVQIKDGAVSGCRIVDQGSGYTAATIAFTTPNTTTAGSGANATVGIENGKVASIQMIVGGTLTLSYDSADTLTITIYGRDKDFMPVSLALQGNGASAANPFVSIERIHKEQGTVVLTLTHTSISNEITPLAIMAPKEEETCYRRYIIDELTNTPNEIVSALAKLRHVEFTADSDIVPISNIYAIEMGLQAYQYDIEGDATNGSQYWQKMIDALNDELKDMKSPDEVPSVRFHYPGNTKPRMSSTM